MVELFGTYAGYYEVWNEDEDGFHDAGIRRYEAFEAVEETLTGWVVEPAVAIAAVTAAAQRDSGVEGYDTRWRIEPTAEGAGISYARAGEDSRRVERDTGGNYLLPWLEFPSVAGQVDRGLVDRIVTATGTFNAIEYDARGAAASGKPPEAPGTGEAWVPQAVNGAGIETKPGPESPGPAKGRPLL